MAALIVPPVIGWIADFLRLAWGLLYWNTRKSLFQRRGRSGRAPCQNPSDSGRAAETQCEACLHWDRPARFARVCPLLVSTPAGLRCSVNASDVRPFWGLAFGYYGGTFLALYLAGVLGVFAFLRTIGYPISIVHVAWPGLWHRVPEARGAFFYEKGVRAMQAGRIKEGLLNFDNAYRFDPGNYSAGLALARNYQAAQPVLSDSLYARLYQEHVGQRSATAQDWFRSLLARGAFEPLSELATKEILAFPDRASPWMRALFFATRQSANDTPLRALLDRPEAALWHPLLRRELQLREQPASGQAALRDPWPLSAPSYAHYRQVEALIEIGDTFSALDQLARVAGRLDDESSLVLRLGALARGQHRSQLTYESGVLLGRPFTPALIKTLCVHLIRHPNPDLARLLNERVERAKLPLDNENAGTFFSLLCVFGSNGDRAAVAALTARIKTMTSTPFLALNSLEAFFRQETATSRIANFLPIVPLPAEVTYALLERYPGTTGRTVKSSP